MSQILVSARPDYIAPGMVVFVAFLALWLSDRSRRFALYLGLSAAVSALTAALVPMDMPMSTPISASLSGLGAGVVVATVLMLLGASELGGWSQRRTVAAVMAIAALPALGSLRVLPLGPVGISDLASMPGSLLVAAALWSRRDAVLRLAGVLLAVRGMNMLALTTIIPGYTLLERVALNQLLLYASGVVLLAGGFLRVLAELAEERDQLLREVEQRTEELQARRNTLLNINHALEQLATSVSAHLERPLARMRAATASLLEGERVTRLGPVGQGYVGRMVAAAQRMQQIVQSLLRLSRVAVHTLQRERLDLGAMARECFAQLAARQAGSPPRLEVEEGLGAHADRALLTSVLENLLGNAWKYSARHPAPHIVVGRSAQCPHGFVVRDNGAGFDPGEADKLFVPFQRLHDARDFEGTGVGLATVQRIIARHGGRIWAEGRPGEGAAFHFTLGD